MLQQQTFDASSPKVNIARVVDATLRFDAARLVDAIVFHMVDEEIATAVVPDTVKRTLDRLRAKSFETSIARHQWAKMTNSHRLQWLLDESETAFLVGDDETVALRTRRGK